MGDAMDHLRRRAEESPEAPAIVGLPEREGEPSPIWSYRELDRRVDIVALALIRGGIGVGDRIGARLPPSPEAVVLFHAVVRSGAVLVPLNPNWTQVEIARGLAATGVPSLIVSGLGELVDWSVPGQPVGSVEGVSLPTIRPDSPATILLTSGSTGEPRPITLTHRNLLASAEGAIRRLGLSAEDRWLTSLSPGHIGGLALIHRAAVIGCGLLTRPRFDPAEVVELIDAGAVTHLSLVPVMLSRLLDLRGDRPPTSSLRCLLLGGDRLPLPLLERALALGYPIALTYGMTEASSQIATAGPEEVRKKPGSVGRALDGVEVKIQDPGADGVGEILARGPTVAEGLPILTEREGDTPSVFRDAEGWLHTGDLGRIDEDGDLGVAGRLTDRIVTAGVTVEPAEIEEVLSRHPKILEVAAVGVPDAEWGERVLLAVVPRDPRSPPDLDELLDFTRERLAPAKRPRELRILESLPRNERGKVVRARLRG